MSIESHLAELTKRHNNLQQQIEDAAAHPSMSQLEIAALKRKKLLLKDQIYRLSSETTAH